MGAAIECFEGAAAMEVPRSRFAPVKTTADFRALRSDAYQVLENGQVRLHPARDGRPPVISLSEEYRMVDSIGQLGVPGLLKCRSLVISGPLRFEPGVVIEGDVEFRNDSSDPLFVRAGIYRG
jgi:hypothetical protein